jgi:hypothetical protein
MNTYEGIKGIYDLVEQIRRWRWKDNAADMMHARDLPSPNAVRREQLGKISLMASLNGGPQPLILTCFRIQHS